MTDILYDYHIATSMHAQDGHLNVEKMYADILEKYGVTQAEFDSSMVYYTRHYTMLNDVYGRIEERMMARAVAMGGSVQDINSMGEAFSSSDTANIWNAETAVLLLPYAPRHVMQFNIPTDTTSHPGDKYLLSFDAEFLVQGGSRDLVAMLATRLNTDSVMYSTQHISYPMHGSLTVDDTERKGVKTLSGFFTFKTDVTDNRNTAALALVRNIKLIRMHTPPPNPEPAVPSDSVAQQPAPADSLAEPLAESPTPITPITQQP